MTEVSIKQLIPAFLWRDRDGNALAMAIEAGLRYMCEAITDSITEMTDPEKMTEWRLDEMAWELGCLYDTNGTIENKRKWVINAIPYSASYGTAEAIRLYLMGVFQDVEVEEAWQYGGEPFHFRVIVGGTWTPEKEAWARKAVASTKNVRSVLDSVASTNDAVLKLTGSGETIGFFYPLAAGDIYTGEYPFED